MFEMTVLPLVYNIPYLQNDKCLLWFGANFIGKLTVFGRVLDKCAKTVIIITPKTVLRNCVMVARRLDSVCEGSNPSSVIKQVTNFLLKFVILFFS